MLSISDKDARQTTLAKPVIEIESSYKLLKAASRYYESLAYAFAVIYQEVDRKPGARE